MAVVVLLAGGGANGHRRRPLYLFFRTHMGMWAWPIAVVVAIVVPVWIAEHQRRRRWMQERYVRALEQLRREVQLVREERSRLHEYTRAVREEHHIE